MEELEKLFPFSKSIDKNQVMTLVIAIVIYVIAGAVGGLLIALLMNVPILGFLFGIVGTLIGLYCLGGIIFSIAKFLK